MDIKSLLEWCKKQAKFYDKEANTANSDDWFDFCVGKRNAYEEVCNYILARINKECK